MIGDFSYLYSMKKIHLLTVLLGCLCACNPLAEIPLSGEYLLAVNEIVDFVADDVFQAFGAKDYPELSDLARNLLRAEAYRAAVVTYHTVDPWGNPVVADATFYYPTDVKIKGVIEMSGIAHLHKTGGSTDNVPVMECLPILTGYAVILPDMIGYGKYGNTKEMMHPYGMSDNLGRVAYDCRMAAIEYFNSIGYRVPKKTIIAGYSYGGGVGLAVAKYYQTNHPEIDIDRLVIGGGAHDLNAAFQGYVEHPICTYPLLPGILMALDYYNHLNLDYSQIFIGELALHYQEWYDRSMSASSVLNFVGEDMRNYMHPDFFKPREQQNAEFQKLYPVLTANSAVDGWTPNMPIYLYHSDEDLFVPTKCADYAAEQFGRKGVYVYYEHGKGNHANWGVRTFVDLCLYLLIN